MHIALYREFRPVTFDELIGQDHIVRILKNQIRTGRTSHAYLFSGTRGTGKTTTARILARALNCSGEGEKPCGHCENCLSAVEGSFVDVIEMDAASHRSVTDIQEITDSVMYAPSAGRYKVYIIDEVHMLSTEAFNALLKTLEEPPEHVVFILATTEPQKVPATILSRCMKLDFRRVSENELTANMKSICEKKQIEAEEGALSLIAVNADGSVRDSLSILEQCICPGEPLRRDDVAAVLGTAGVEPLLQLTDFVLGEDPSGALLLLNEIFSAGSETKQFMKEWLGHFRNLLIAKYVQNPSRILNMSAENAARVTEQSRRISQQMLERCIRELTETISLTKWARHPRVMLEMSIVKLSVPEEQPENYSAKRNCPRRADLPSSGMTKPSAPAADRAAPGQPREDMEVAGMAERITAVSSAGDLSDLTRRDNVDIQENADNLEMQQAPEPAALTEEEWTQVVDQAASGILTRLSGRTFLEREQDGQVYISCADKVTMDLLKNRGKERLEQILLQKTGRKLNIVAELRKTEQNRSQTVDSEQQMMLDAFFGREVPVRVSD